MSIEVVPLAPGDYAQWDSYMSDKRASIYYDTRWIDLIQQVFGQTCHHLVAKQRGEIIGGLPMVQLKSLLFGNFMVSMPYFNYGGLVASSKESASQLLSAGCKLSRDLGCKHFELRFDQPIDASLTERKDKVTMLLDLPPNADELWHAIGSKRRAQVKRPIREGVTFTTGGVELLDDFYAVFAHNMRDLGTPVYSKRFFKEILTRFEDESFLAIVHLNDEAVGAGFLIGRQGRLEIPWASTLRKTNRIGVNMFLYWNILKTAIEKEFKVFDFGRSSKDAGTLKFKRQWGAKEKQLYWYYDLPQGQPLPDLNPASGKYNTAISVWQKLPVSLTKICGPLIVKNLP